MDRLNQTRIEVFVFDIEGRCEYANPAALRYTGNKSWREGLTLSDWGFSPEEVAKRRRNWMWICNTQQCRSLVGKDPSTEGRMVYVEVCPSGRQHVIVHRLPIVDIVNAVPADWLAEAAAS